MHTFSHLLVLLNLEKNTLVNLVHEICQCVGKWDYASYEEEPVQFSMVSGRQSVPFLT